jgi:uncharacterized protein involved in oxidation of intracellular sulfur
VRFLFVLNDPPTVPSAPMTVCAWPYALAKRDEAEVRVFLIADAVGCAVAGQ